MKLFSYTPLVKAVKKNIFLLAGLSLITSGQTFAAEEDGAEENDKKIIITGSRLNRSNAETAQPVTIITREDIERTGDISVSEVLRDLPFATTGSFFGSGGSSASNHANTDLRGLGGGRTLYLIDGIRIAGGATAGASEANANLIPLAAVEEIHILREGASSIYGSDAIGGVINIITRKDYDGANFSIHRGETAQGGGEENDAKLTFGFSGEKTTGVLAFGRQTYGGIKGGERPHLRNADDDPFNTYATFPAGPEGIWRAVEFDPVDPQYNLFARWNAGPNCPADQIEIVEGRDASDWCNFPIYEGRDFLPANTSDSFFASITRELNEDMNVWVRANYNSQEAKTTSTPLWSGTRGMAADNVFNPTFGTPDQQAIQYYHLLVDVADREYLFDSSSKSLSAGFDWENNVGTLNAYYSHSENRTDIRGNSYVLLDVFEQAVDDEIYNPFIRGGGPLATDEVKDSFLHTFTRLATSQTKSVGISWNSETDFELAGGNVSYAAGYEYHEEEFSDLQDRQTNAGNVLGAFGGDSGGSRDYSAVFFEVALPLLQDLEVHIATRNDSYSLPDKSAQTSSLRLAYRPIDSLLIRGGFSEGFRAPSIDDLLSSAAVSFDEVYDPACTDADCPTEQKERHSSGNPDLSPEESTQKSLGVVYSPTDEFDIALDYYDITIENQVTYVGAQSVLVLDSRGELGGFAQCSIEYDGLGTAFDNITVINACQGNTEGYITKGVDLNINYRLNMADMGDIRFNLLASKPTEWSYKTTPTAPRFDWLGFNGFPELRYTFNTLWNYDAFTVALSYNHVAGFDGDRPDRENSELPSYDDFNTLDLNVSFDADEYGRFVIGARNLTDEMPTINRDLLFPGYDEANHDIHGRVVYASYTIDF